METLLIYLGKLILCSAVLLGYYHLFLKDRTFHDYNRFYLLSAVFISLLLPLLKISYFTLEVQQNIFLLLNALQQYQAVSPEDHNGTFYVGIMFSGIFTLVLLGKLIAGHIKIHSLKRKFPMEQMQGISVYHTNLEDAPFSFFKSLFWRNSIPLQSDIGKQILKHEMVHIEQNHSWDKLFMEFICSVLWFNPLFWLIKKELFLIHEYLADNKAVINLDTKAFAQMLLASHFSGNNLPTTNPFLSSNLKKRLQMLQKPKTKFGYLHRVLALPLLFTIAFAYAVNAKNIEIAEFNSEIKKITNKQLAAVLTTTEMQGKPASLPIMPPAAVMGIKADTAQSTEKRSTAVKTYDPLVVNLFRASDSNLFIINGKEVLREDFIKFYLANRNNKKYSFGATNQTFSKINESGKTAAFSVFEEGADEATKNTLAIIGKYAELLRVGPVSNAEAQTFGSSAKGNEQDLKAFFEKADKERIVREQAKAAKKAEMDATIKKLVNSSKFKDNFDPGRNYALQPLTSEEKAHLKEEASKIEEIYTTFNDASEIMMNFFRTNALSNYTFQLDGQLIKKDYINRRDIVLPFSSDHTTFYINGKKVPRNSVMNKTDSPADAESFLKDADIKEIKQEYVSDGKRKYLYRFELLTK